MKLDALQPQLLDGVQLGDRPLAFVRVHAAETDEHVRVIAYGAGDELVGEPGALGCGLSVPGQEQRQHVQLPILLGHLLQRLARDL